jgi:hypothetical protein
MFDDWDIEAGLWVVLCFLLLAFVMVGFVALCLM